VLGSDPDLLAYFMQLPEDGPGAADVRPEDPERIELRFPTKRLADAFLSGLRCRKKQCMCGVARNSGFEGVGHCPRCGGVAEFERLCYGRTLRLQCRDGCAAQPFVLDVWTLAGAWGRTNYYWRLVYWAEESGIDALVSESLRVQGRLGE
jgi:hypothetical protein